MCGTYGSVVYIHASIIVYTVYTILYIIHIAITTVLWIKLKTVPPAAAAFVKIIFYINEWAHNGINRVVHQACSPPHLFL